MTTVLVVGPHSRPFIGDWLAATDAVATAVAVDLSGDAPKAKRSKLHRRVVTLRPSRVFASLNDRRVSADVRRQLDSLDIQPDIIHSHFYPCARSILDLQQILQVPLVHTEHSSSVISSKTLGRQALGRLRSILCSASVTTAVGPELVKVLQGLEPEADVRLLSNPVPIDLMLARRLATTGVRVLGAGSLNAGKRFGLQIEAIEQLAQRLGTSRSDLRLAGTGPLEDELVAKARFLGVDSFVSLLGEVDRSVLHQEMADADVFLHTATQETFGVVLVEALYQGTPVVATNCGGVVDLAVGATGLVVLPQDARAADIADAILATLQSKPTRDAIRSSALVCFDPSRVARSLGHIYKDVLERFSNSSEVAPV